MSVVRKFVSLLVLIGCGFVSSSALAQSGQPNILVILADDMGNGDVSFKRVPVRACPVLTDITCVPKKVGRKIRAVFSQIVVSISFQP